MGAPENKAADRPGLAAASMGTVGVVPRVGPHAVRHIDTPDRRPAGGSVEDPKTGRSIVRPSASPPDLHPTRAGRPGLRRRSTANPGEIPGGKGTDDAADERGADVHENFDSTRVSSLEELNELARELTDDLVECFFVVT